MPDQTREGTPTPETPSKTETKVETNAGENLGLLAETLRDRGQPGRFSMYATAPQMGGAPIMVQASAVECRDVEWLWAKTFPLGKISLLVGDPGRGKSLLAIDTAARLSTGAPWPDGSPNVYGPARTLMLTAEDDLADTVRPRIEAACGDAAMITVLKGFKATAFRSSGLVLPRDLAALEDVIKHEPNLRLLVVDPVLAFLSTTAGTNNSALRALLASLQLIAEEHRFAILLISHLTKAHSASPLYRAMGSLSLVAASRAVWTLWPDLDEAARTFFVPLKCNLAPAISAYAYRIASRPDMAEVPFLLWDPDPLPLTLVSTSTANPLPRLVDRQAISWLSDALREGPLAAAEIDEGGEELGFSKHVIRRAKAALGVQSYPEEFGKRWLCKLP